MSLQLTFTPRRVGLFLGAIALYLTLQSLLTEFILVEVLGDTTLSVPRLLLDLFSVNLEESIPTWYATILLFCAAVLLAVIARAKLQAEADYRWHWVGLALTFLYLSLDEGAVIHEIFADPMQEAFNTSGFLAFGWQILAVPLVILFGLVYLRFLFHLPVPARNGFILAAVLYVGGAIVIEGFSAAAWDANDSDMEMTYLSIATLEEFCETIGVVVFITVLLAYIQAQPYNLTVTPASADAAPIADGDGRRRVWVRGVLALCVVTIGVNLALTAWADALNDNTDDAIFVAPGQIYQVFQDRFADEDVVVSYMTVAFELQDENSRQLAAAFLDRFDDLIIVNLVASESTLILAGADVGISNDELGDLLHQSGETEFIIFEAPLIRAMVAGA